MSTHNEILLHLENIRKTYASSSTPDPEWVLDGIDLDLRHGQSLSILGPSGCGKSTLLNIIGGIDHPTSGHVTLQGTILDRLEDETLSAVRRDKIGFIFQFHHLFPHCTVLENVLVPVLAGPAPHPMRTREIRARALLERVGLVHRLDHRPAELSGGEKQRVAVVRAMINEPVLLLADEPTGSLDESNAATLAGLLLELNAEQHVALIVVTHDRSLALRMEHTCTICNGKLISVGQPAVHTP